MGTNHRPNMLPPLLESDHNRRRTSRPDIFPVKTSFNQSEVFRTKIVGKLRALQVKQYKAQGRDPRLKPQLKALQRIYKDVGGMTCLDAAESWIDREIARLEGGQGSDHPSEPG